MSSSASETPIRLTVQIMGNLQVRRGNTVLDARGLGGPKPRQILEILLLQLGHPVSKDKLIELLWAGHPPLEALPTLESYVSVLRKHLQPGTGKLGPLRTTTGGYIMERLLVDLDLDRFDSLVRSAQQSAPPLAYPMLQHALDLAAAPLFADELVPAWAEEERSLHNAQVNDALILAAETAAALGRSEEGIGWANQALRGDPLNERAWTALILALEQAGRHAEGLMAFERCRRLMSRELGCMPGETLRAAHVRLLRATADGEDEFSGILSALLVLHDQLRAGAAGLADSARILSADPAKDPRQEAGKVISSFLQRALSSA